MNKSLSDIWAALQADLRRSVVDNKHPWRYYTLATYEIANGADARTVVNRAVTEDFQLVIFTDSRVNKVRQLRQDDRATLLFYHPKRRTQLRIKCRAQVITEGDLYNNYKSSLGAHSKNDYNTSEAPGTAIDDYISRDDDLHFAVVIFSPYEVDYLQLSREGHSRAVFKEKGSRWTGDVVIP